MALTAIFPKPRLRDASAAGAGVPANLVGATTGANARNWPFIFREINGVMVAVSQPFTGPAIIREINLALGVGGAAVFPTLQLYVSDDNSGGGSNQANTFIPSGEPIFDLNVNQRDDGVGVADANGPTIFDLSEAAGYWRWPINRVTYKTRFFLKLRVNNTTATSAFGQGYVNVLENVAPGEVANFL